MSISLAHKTVGEVIMAPSHLGRRPGEFFRMLSPEVQRLIVQGVNSPVQPADWWIKQVCG